MHGSDFLSPLLSFLGVAVTGAVTWLVKRTPEKKNPQDYQGDQIKSLLEQVKAQDSRMRDLEDSSARQWSVIQELRGKVDSLYTRLRKVVDYARNLEARLSEVTGAPHQRPHDLNAIFEDDKN